MTITTRLREFVQECVRVLKVTRKPDRYEYTAIVKVAGLGMALIGLIGFIVQLIKQLLI